MEEHGRDDDRDAEPAASSPDRHLGDAHQPLRNPALGHDRACEDEQRDGEEGEGIERVEDLLGHRVDHASRLRRQQKPQHARSAQAKRYRHPDRDEKEEGDEDDDAHGPAPSTLSLVSPIRASGGAEGFLHQIDLDIRVALVALAEALAGAKGQQAVREIEQVDEE